MNAVSHPGPPPAFDLASLPASCRAGEGVRIYARHARIGDGAVLGNGVTIVGDDVTLGSGVVIGDGSDLRASTVHIGDGSEIHSRVRVLVAERFVVGDAGRIASGVSVLCRDFVAGRLFYLGDGANVGFGGTTTSTATLRIGDRVTISQHAILNANCAIDIGDNVGTGSYLAIWTHGYHFGHGPLIGIQPAYAPVRIGRNAWLGFHVTILPGTSVGENSIVAAGSVVTTDVPADVLVAGVPARVKKTLDKKMVAGAPAQAAVVDVLRVWQRELEWKGCRIAASRYDSDRADLTVSRADGTDQTRVVLLTAQDPLPEPHSPNEALAMITIDERSDLRTIAGGSVAVFELRTGGLYGHTSCVIEDLRDQLRRHAMPCGDRTCFSSIEPAGFSRLRSATSGAL